MPLRGEGAAVLGVGVVARDLTDTQRALEAERGLRQSEEAKAALEVHLRQQQKLEALGTLASGVAHEINNPINVILNYAELLADEVAEGPAREYARQVTAEGERVARIVRDVMLEPDLPHFSCRPQQVQQVLTNLLTNATTWIRSCRSRIRARCSRPTTTTRSYTTAGSTTAPRCSPSWRPRSTGSPAWPCCWGGLPLWLGEMGGPWETPGFELYLSDLLTTLARRGWGFAQYDDAPSGSFALRTAPGVFRDDFARLVPLCAACPGRCRSRRSTCRAARS